MRRVSYTFIEFLQKRVLNCQVSYHAISYLESFFPWSNLGTSLSDNPSKYTLHLLKRETFELLFISSFQSQNP